MLRQRPISLSTPPRNCCDVSPSLLRKWTTSTSWSTFDPPRSLIHSRPTGGLEGKFSMQYCLAAEIIDGQIGLATFSDEQVMRAEAQDLIPRIDMRRHAGYEGQTSWTEAHNRVEVHLKDGRVLSERADPRNYRRPPRRDSRGRTRQVPGLRRRGSQ